METLLLGVDFTCAPSRRKPITVASGRLHGALLRLDETSALPDLPAFEQLVAAPGPWLGAFDFPFGLPRRFVDDLALGDSTDAVIGELHRRCGSRMAFRAMVDGWGNVRRGGEGGGALLHRATDGSLRGPVSTSPLQTRYVPVGFMYFEGLSRLVRAGVTIPGMRQGDPARVAVEGYPGLLAHELIGRRSYKNSPLPDRLIARKEIVDALEQGRTRHALRLKLGHAQREALVDDPSGDRLDAVLCLVQAAAVARQPGNGVPQGVDTVEGWIATA